MGGDIKLEIETTGDDYLWQRLSGRKPRPVSGKLEIMDAEGVSPIRTLEWYDGYIYAVEEGMYSLSAMPMTQKLLITTKRMDINSTVKLDRRFPETYGFWWEEYKEPESVIVAAEEDSEAEEEITPHITSAAWLNEEDTPVTFIPTTLDETVTMHIETTGFDNPENDDEEVRIEIKDEEKNVLFDYTTRPNKEGVIDLDLTVEEILSEKHDKPTEYLKEHPDLKLSLFASRLHNPDEKQEATLQQQAQCTVKFRRDGTYHPKTAPDSYKGDFLFDWYREGDDDTPLSQWYNDPTMMDPASFNNFMNYNYQSFEEEWKKTHPTYKENYKYAIPAMTIVPGFTACLRLKLTVENPVDKIDFRITGGDEDTFSLSFNSFSVQNKNTHYYHAEKLKITCNKVFSKTMFLEACVGEQVVGKLEFIPNHEAYKMNISIIPVKLCDKDLNIFEIPKIARKEVQRMEQLFQQLYIFPHIHILPILNCTEDKYTFKYNSVEKQVPLFTASFLLSENNKSINYTKKTRQDSYIDDNIKNKTIYEYLNLKASVLYKDTKYNNIYNTSCKLFIFSIPAYSSTTIGITQLEKEENKVTRWIDQVLLFNINENNPFSPGTAVHEVLHTFGLEHPSENKKYKKKYDWKFKSAKTTDNIMDYIEGNEPTVEKRYRASSLWKWQYQMAREIAKEMYKTRITEYKYEKKYYK